jgi:peptide chain release factor 3
MDMERDRGISITSAALQFAYRGSVVNLLDTPGHADFSEDTYRVLSAVDAAVMLLDAAKGLEPQTLKLFQVCRHRGLPIITVVNKWDRPGRDALALMDEIAERIGLRPTPLTWPVGIAGDFRGVLDRRTGGFIRFTRTAGGATIAPEEHLDAAAAEVREGAAWTAAAEEHELLGADGADHDQQEFLGGRTTPVLFASAVQNFGVGQLLDVLLELAPVPSARPGVDGTPRPVDAPFSAFVFKVQAGMDSAHRDRVAFARVCSGAFERGMVTTHEPTGRPFVTKYAQAVFGRERTTLESATRATSSAWSTPRARHRRHAVRRRARCASRPSRASPPSTSRSCGPSTPGSTSSSGAASSSSSRKASCRCCARTCAATRRPSSPAVGPMQFEVATHRFTNEFNAPVRLEPLGFSLARRAREEDLPILQAQRGIEVLTRGDGVMLALFPDRWRLQFVLRDHPSLVLRAAGRRRRRVTRAARVVTMKGSPPPAWSPASRCRSAATGRAPRGERQVHAGEHPRSDLRVVDAASGEGGQREHGDADDGHREQHGRADSPRREDSPTHPPVLDGGRHHQARDDGHQSEHHVSPNPARPARRRRRHGP